MNATQSNLILGADSYKFSHLYQYPEGTTNIESHVTARKGQPGIDQIVFFGLQAWISERLLDPITPQHIKEAKEFATQHGVPFIEDGWKHIVEKHGGYLPLQIDSLLEGTKAPIGVAQVRVINTDPLLPWLTSYIETELMRAVWYPSTVATKSYHAHQILQSRAEASMDIPDVSFKLHDFGQRGASSRQTAALGGMAHLLSFMGTDTTEGVLAANRYYNAGMAGFSIPAMEHSTVTSWGEENEADAFRNMIRNSPGPIVACVSDSFDYYRAVAELWGRQLRDEVIASGKTIVVRPDSGDPLETVMYALNSLAASYGITTNTKGYKVINHMRVIQGDGIGMEVMEKIANAVLDAGFSLENVAFGMGAGLLQNVNRDTFSYAMKANCATINGKQVNVSKHPTTDARKRSWDGPIDVVRREGILVNTAPNDPREWSELHCVYEDGYMHNRQTFADIKKVLHD